MIIRGRTLFRFWLAVVLTAVVGPMVFSRTLVLLAAEPCANQVFGSLDGIDPNLIATDPTSGRKLLIPGVLRGYANVPVRVTGVVCDRDGHALTLTRGDTGAEIPIEPDGICKFEVTFTTPGAQPLDLTLTDGIGTRRGTLLFAITDNANPVFVGFDSQP